MSQPPQFFVDHKRGEVNELKALLSNPKITKDSAKKREVIKKVIAYMTLGIDVSRIFSEMVMAASTKDLVQKKMVYHYLCSYAGSKSDLAILAINTLQKDCRDEDPMVRGLALRSLCSLRLKNSAEYVLLPIRKGLNDQSAYVRKTAVAGCAKLHREDPVALRNTDLVDVLYNLLKDSDTAVIANVINSLNQILDSEGGMVFNQQIVMYLLNRIKEFNEWGQCSVLALLAKYQPTDQQQMFDIMNLLTDRLQHSNSAVVMGTTKVFLNFTVQYPEVHAQVVDRLKPPLLTLMGGGTVELAYVVLSHVVVLVDRSPGVFDSDYKHFFCRFNDPSCVKNLKLQVVTKLANPHNYSEILQELAEYVTDPDIEIARSSIKWIGGISVKIDSAVDEAIELLLSFLDLNTDYVSAEAIIAIKDLLRKYPERYEEVLPALDKCMRNFDLESDGKVACIWMIGEYGDTIDDAPYLLEPLIDAFEEEASHAVRQEILSSCMKLFFKRPPEMKAMLGRLLKAAIEDTTKVDVRDRALLYYRLLQADVHECARVVNCPKVIVEAFVESTDTEMKEKIFREFNSLSVVYSLPSSSFVKIRSREEEEEEREAYEAELARANQPDYEVEPASPAAAEPDPSSAPDALGQQQQQPPQQQQGGQDVDLLDMFSNVGVSSPAQPAAAAAAFSLAPNPVVDAPTFQGNWPTLPVAGNVNIQLAPNPAEKAVEQAVNAAHIMTMASGTQGPMMKFYFYARTPANGLFLVEANITIATGAANLIIKSDTPADQHNGFVELFKQALAPLCHQQPLF
mmetsp:Transcript_6379/g.12074  ORF Transcript_6379/g.12074 Transcript_6379/m.12074 type:complete len:795 (+) Transcript_6379:28-2412(+)